MITPNRVGLAVAVLYLIFAVYVVIDDRSHPAFLSNMATFLVTAPISFPLSWAGFEPDLRKLGMVGLLVAGNAALVYRLAWGLARIFMVPSGKT